MGENEIPDEEQIEPVAEPEPEPEPEPPVRVPCGNPNCGKVFEFPAYSEDGRLIESFSFQCSNCGASNQWSRT